jgi:murein DD-endopeptidase / murein LD-carboxypeptidase
MQKLFHIRGNLILVIVAAIMLINTFCSRHFIPESSLHNRVSGTEKVRLQEFMEEGTERELGTGKTSPDDLIRTAKQYLGVPHCMGGKTMKCMDCSGLVVTVFASHGISLPHNSEDQARYGKILEGMDELRKGDLVFFVRSYRTQRFITHSGIYVGDNKFIHASSQRGVTITSINDPWWSEKFIFATRVLK